MLTPTELEARRAARRARTEAIGSTVQAEVKVCGCCRKSYDRAAFLALALPSNGIGESMGMTWRNCSCDSTLVW